MNLPVYKLVIDEQSEDLQVDAVALVDKPAIERNFLAFVFYNPEQPRDESGRWGEGGNPNKNSEKDATSSVIAKETAKDLGLTDNDYNIVSNTKLKAAGAVDWGFNKAEGKWYISPTLYINESHKDFGGKNGHTREQVIKHEMRHIWQSKNKGFYIKDKQIFWEDKPHISQKQYNSILTGMTKAKTKEQFLENRKKYNDLPWEKDANKYSGTNADTFSETIDFPLPIDIIEFPNVNASFQVFAVENEEERIITGPAMLADTPIYRNDERGEYYVVFDAPTIKQIAQKYFAKGFQNNVNLQHDKGQIVEGVTVFESWIVDSKRGIAPMKGFENVPEGSWFISMKVNDDATWQKVKAGEIKGFSVEGVFEYKIANTPEQMLTDALKNFHTVLEQMKTFNI